MSDLIERYATIKLFCEDCCKRRGVHGICGDDDKCQDIDVLKSAPAVNRWIPCSERLPEVYEKVLTYSDDGIIHDNFRLNLRDGSVGWSQGCGITHWQQRPEPPEKE
jgi:hypothetical protein